MLHSGKGGDNTQRSYLLEQAETCHVEVDRVGALSMQSVCICLHGGTRPVWIVYSF